MPANIHNLLISFRKSREPLEKVSNIGGTLVPTVPDPERLEHPKKPEYHKVTIDNRPYWDLKREHKANEDNVLINTYKKWLGNSKVSGNMSENVKGVVEGVLTSPHRHLLSDSENDPHKGLRARHLKNVLKAHMGGPEAREYFLHENSDGSVVAGGVRHSEKDKSKGEITHWRFQNGTVTERKDNQGRDDHLDRHRDGNNPSGADSGPGTVRSYRRGEEGLRTTPEQLVTDPSKSKIVKLNTGVVKRKKKDDLNKAANDRIAHNKDSQTSTPAGNPRMDGSGRAGSSDAHSGDIRGYRRGQDVRAQPVAPIAEKAEVERIGSGVMKRKSLTKADKNLAEWQKHENPISRNKIKPLDGKQRQQALEHLANQTKTSVINGQKHYLLHRGMGHQEYHGATKRPNAITHHDSTSWTPSFDSAKGFGERYAEADQIEHSISHKPYTVSAWIPEHKIKHVLSQAKDSDKSYDENEVIAHPDHGGIPFKKMNKSLKLLKSFKSEKLTKDLSQINFKNLMPETRPEQDVRKQGPSNLNVKTTAKLATGYHPIKGLADSLAEGIRKKPYDSGFHDPYKSKISVSSQWAPAATAHEGHHRVASKLAEKYGVVGANRLYDKLIGLIPPNIAPAIHSLAQSHPEYAGMSRSPKSLHQLQYKQEIINFIRDLVTSGGTREAAKYDKNPKLSSGAARGKYVSEDFTDPAKFKEINTGLKQAWKNIVNFAAKANKEHLK